LRLLNPVYYAHINRYGLFERDLKGLSFLEASQLFLMSISLG